MGASERGWGVTKKIKSGQRVGLGSDKIEKLSIISMTHKLNKARIRHLEMEKLNCEDKGALWRNEDERFDLELENFGVNIDDINDTPACPKRYFRCWVEQWEVPLHNENFAAEKYKFLQKYKGLVFTDNFDGVF